MPVDSLTESNFYKSKFMHKLIYIKKKIIKDTVLFCSYVDIICKLRENRYF